MIGNQPIRISEIAQKEIKDTLQTNKIPNEYGLRVGIKGGGCSAQFLLGFDLPTSNDDIYTIENIKVLIDKKHLMYVIGTVVDFEENENSTGFTLVKL